MSVFFLYYAGYFCVHCIPSGSVRGFLEHFQQYSENQCLGTGILFKDERDYILLWEPRKKRMTI